MRSIIALASVTVLTACASQTPIPEKAAAAPAPAASAVTADKRIPQCYSGDAGKFFNAGERTNIAGFNVECKPNSDGKSGQWMGIKH